MNKLFLSIMLLNVITMSCATYAQNELILADSLRENGQLREAISLYKISYKEYPTDKSIPFNLARAYSLIEERDSAFKYLELFTSLDTSIRPLVEPDFLGLTSDQKWDNITEQLINKVQQTYGAYQKLEIAKELWRMEMEDQAYYYHIELIEKRIGTNSVVSKPIWQMKKKMNAQNVLQLEKLIEKHGWIKRSEVGGTASETLFYIIQHAEYSVQKKYFPLLKDAVEQGEAERSSLAYLTDRIQVEEKGTQVFGTQIGFNEETQTYYVLPIEDDSNIDELRKSFELEPLQEYLSFWGIEYSPSE